MREETVSLREGGVQEHHLSMRATRSLVVPPEEGRTSTGLLDQPSPPTHLDIFIRGNPDYGNILLDEDKNIFQITQ